VRVVWSRGALREIGRIHAYIADFNPSAAARLAAALLAAGDSLEHFAHRGRPVGDNLRELTVVSPYIIRYEIRGRDVHILRVRHGMRRQPS
jgi:toxin ParE1/3/4